MVNEERDFEYIENEDERFNHRYAMEGRKSYTQQTKKGIREQLDHRFYRFGRIRSSSGAETDSF